jgi:hypothetical protein
MQIPMSMDSTIDVEAGTTKFEIIHPAAWAVPVCLAIYHRDRPIELYLRCEVSTIQVSLNYMKARYDILNLQDTHANHEPDPGGPNLTKRQPYGSIADHSSREKDTRG